MADELDFVGYTGWVDDKEAVENVVAQLPFKSFAETPAATVSLDAIPQRVALWEIAAKVLGQPLPARSQGDVGSCVSFGTASAVEATMLSEIYLGQLEEYKDIVQEAIYGGSRVEVGKGKLGRQDGSVGAWAAKWVREWGILPRGIVAGFDLTNYSIPLCRTWGAKGVPLDLETESKKHPVMETTPVTSWVQAKKCLAQGYGISICSSRGFTTKRDSEGVCAPRGVWEHCMCLLGYKTVGKKEYGWIKNSWGKYLTGPIADGDPSDDGFWAAADVIDEDILRLGDSFAFSGVKGFVARQIDWRTL